MIGAAAVAASLLTATGAPGFAPADGWNTSRTGDAVLPQAGAALTATVELLDRPGDLPRKTVASLGPDDVLIQAVIYGRAGFRPALDRAYRPRRLPLRVRQGVARRYVITGRVEGWLTETVVYFGSANPDASTRRLANAQLGRLILPSPCPSDPRELPGRLGAAEDAVRALLFVRVDHSVTPPADYRRPRLSARRGAPERILPAACRLVPPDRVAVVEVRFPFLTDRPRLAHHTYLVSRQRGRYVVWERVR